MTDGPRPTPDSSPGWAAEQPPPYGGSPGSWASPGAAPDGPPPPPPGPGQGHGQGYGQGHGQGHGPGQAYDPARGGQPGVPYPQAPGFPGPPAPGAPHNPYGPYAPYPQAPGYGRPDSPRPGIIPLRPLTFGDILDGTIKLIRSNPRATLGLSAIIAVVTTIPLAIQQALQFADIGSTMDDLTAGAQTPSALTASYLGSLITLVMSFVATTVLTGVLTRVLGRAVFGGRITVGEAWALVRSRVPALLGLVLLQLLILTAPLLIVAAGVAGLALAGSFDETSLGGLVGLMVLIFVLYLPYLLFFQARLALAAPAVVLERLGPAGAVRRSWNLVRGDSWRVLGILLVTLVLTRLLSGVLSIPFSLAGSVLGVLGRGTAASVFVSILLLIIGNVLAAMITQPVQAGVNGLLYADRRMRAEAFDLVLRTAATHNQSQGWVHAGVDDLWHPSNAAGLDPRNPQP
ncbi:glycerophosphoryl diester phosphodiesterase membrane domain-containing protein [Microbispora sp. RL4-1S]|uniref:Glycerophosphoryl diester phosphodiesterase membrane domain-containing protein n=1 Tax=Microbispora oryzae TaxID=2806554 RepID=A0A940WR90_9ACTN|nr:glycerophosphoryl diester phosphodiesterase membrane domain-containing protein [Microbispora oryzae]MBP2706020.1 glycerophosphoryl diester phosphodiesterase membrane domain-containing protein [Microbispora oryzae]